MDDIQFDCLTRRLVLGGFAVGSLAALLEHDEAEGLSKRKRCRKKKRKFCAGRCCPRGRRCEAKTCVRSCDSPFSCASVGAPCSGEACFCSLTLTGTAACTDVGFDLCTDLEACSGDNPCPAGKICASCACPGGMDDFRCFAPC